MGDHTGHGSQTVDLEMREGRGCRDDRGRDRWCGIGLLAGGEG